MKAAGTRGNEENVMANETLYEALKPLLEHGQVTVTFESHPGQVSMSVGYVRDGKLHDREYRAVVKGVELFRGDFLADILLRMIREEAKR